MLLKLFSRNALGALQSMHWKGNVRELKNVVERAVVLVLAPVLVAEADLFLGDGPASKEQGNGLSMPRQGPRAMEKEAIIETLKNRRGNRTQHAEKILGISVRTLRNKLKEYDDFSREKNSDWESLTH